MFLCFYKKKLWREEKEANIAVLTRQHATAVKEATSSCCYSDIQDTLT